MLSSRHLLHRIAGTSRAPALHRPAIVCDDISQLAVDDTTGAPYPELQILFSRLNPSSRDFGTDVQTLLACSHMVGLLRTTWPITGIRIEPTAGTLGVDQEHIAPDPDGGFLVLIEITGSLWLASQRQAPESFTSTHEVPAAVMASVVAVASALYREFRSAARTVSPPR